MSEVNFSHVSNGVDLTPVLDDVVDHWSDLFWPLIVVNSETLTPPSLGIVAFRNEDIGTDFGPLMATATLVVAPLMIAFLATQRWFIEGLTHGAVK
ncbi:carbohydrate ABC transporter permease [Rhizobium miluonense]|uniref:Multiple sugar transport system permease protein n=1 Tax=Rhizobium miluonense TaxID=411945 RepID=A0A1C3WDJ1_9HYPH|nr:carbohydrate ABC transporter permease [Rhizobium miluonense]SCB38033.1 multiple sugar transport system permease protein [Rhizobium miluonense]